MRGRGRVDVKMGEVRVEVEKGGGPFGEGEGELSRLILNNCSPNYVENHTSIFFLVMIVVCEVPEAGCLHLTIGYDIGLSLVKACQGNRPQLFTRYSARITLRVKHQPCSNLEYGHLPERYFRA